MLSLSLDAKKLQIYSENETKRLKMPYKMNMKI